MAGSAEPALLTSAGCWLEHADRRRAGRTEDSREGDPFSDACADRRTGDAHPDIPLQHERWVRLRKRRLEPGAREPQRALKGVSPNDHVAQVAGNGNGGAAIATGWQLVTIPLGTLPAGTHTLSLGDYNNKKDSKSEVTTILLDEVAVAPQP